MDLEQPLSVKILELADELSKEEPKIKRTENEISRLRGHLIRSAQPLLERWIEGQADTSLRELLTAWRHVARVMGIQRKADILAERLQLERARIDDENRSLCSQLEEARRSTAALEEALSSERHLVEGLAKEAAAQQEQGDCVAEQLQDAERLMLRLQGHFQPCTEQDWVISTSSADVHTPPEPKPFSLGNSLEQRGIQLPRLSLPPTLSPPSLAPPHLGAKTSHGACEDIAQDEVLRDVNEQADVLIQTIGAQNQLGAEAPARNALASSRSQIILRSTPQSQVTLGTVAARVAAPAFSTPVVRHTPRATTQLSSGTSLLVTQPLIGPSGNVGPWKPP